MLAALVLVLPSASVAQVNTDQVMRIGQNAMYFDDYVLSIQYFNQAIQAKPYLAQPYFYRAVAKFNLEDYSGAEADASKAIEINPFLADAWEVRGAARHNLGKNELAIEDYDEALRALPRNKQIMFNRSLALAALKRYEQADSSITALLTHYPNFDNAYTARAAVRCELTDTAGARADLEKAIGINPNATNAYLMRAEIAVKSDNDYPAAIADLDQAIKLSPKEAGYYVTRANLKYNINDYFGAMDDYSYALELDPGQKAALYNRAMLRTEVSDLDNALADYNRIIGIDPDNELAYYNRAIILSEKGDLRGAIADISRIIDLYPTLGLPYAIRGEWYKTLGDAARAKADINKSEALMSANRPVSLVKSRTNPFAAFDDNEEKETEQLSQEEFAQRFSSIIDVDTQPTFKEEYNNTAIRGHVQDNDLNMEIEPMMEITYHASPNELRQKAYYLKEADDLNATRLLRRQVAVTNRIPQMSDEATVLSHFESIDYYNSYISTHSPRAADYIGRALDFMAVKDYESAIADLDKAAGLTPASALPYMLRAQARYHTTDAESRMQMLTLVLADLDKAISLSPRNSIAYYNKGNILYEMGDPRAATEAYTHAIELQPDMGEAYYNRGFMQLKLGLRAEGTADLSKSGELGVLAAYSLLKKITK